MLSIVAFPERPDFMLSPRIIVLYQVLKGGRRFVAGVIHNIGNLVISLDLRRPSPPTLPFHTSLPGSDFSCLLNLALDVLDFRHRSFAEYAKS
jgi:hypothetical protein